jgi:uncharacterized protein (DUF2141 family)
MKKLTKIALAVSALATVSSPAWAMGTLAISSASKIDTAAGTNLIVTSTCVRNKGTVKIWVHETKTLAQTKIFTSDGTCKKLWATSGKTHTVSVNSLPAGTYHVILRQDGVQSAPSAPITLP